MPAWTVLGAVEIGRPLLQWFLSDEVMPLRQQLQQLIADPRGNLSRVGDLIVWNGEGGSRVLAGLDGLVEQGSRIEQAVAGIESAQLAMNGVLGTIQTVSLATLGLTAFSGVYMAARFAALNKRLERLSKRIDDMEGQIDAIHKAYLKHALQFLRDYETGCPRSDNLLERAHEQARFAANIYGELAQNEAEGQARLPVLNYRSRCYCLALLTEVECQTLRELDKSASDRIEEEQVRLQRIAQVVFEKTVAKSPEAYLDPSLRDSGVTLELLTEVYHQAHHAGAIKKSAIKDASEMFESIREQVYKRRSGIWWVWRAKGRAKQRYLANLRYLLACLEDTNRIQSLRLLLEATREHKSSPLREIVTKLKAWREQRSKEGSNIGNEQVLAYSFV